ncbi:hypothetical protein D4764_02G0002230 [Takifugu flavidus]|uniref:Uncharacterized protein n=1 Tax=Takifugu flavidus TaxID=433684 RepID=A0A5C6NHU8_9TELE|nr:hypothetical protein D4764_02G0002230 [Takifugu flavidus]
MLLLPLSYFDEKEESMFFHVDDTCLAEEVELGQVPLTPTIIVCGPADDMETSNKQGRRKGNRQNKASKPQHTGVLSLNSTPNHADGRLGKERGEERRGEERRGEERRGEERRGEERRGEERRERRGEERRGEERRGEERRGEERRGEERRERRRRGEERRGEERRGNMTQWGDRGLSGDHVSGPRQPRPITA